MAIFSVLTSLKCLITELNNDIIIKLFYLFTIFTTTTIYTFFIKLQFTFDLLMQLLLAF